MIDSNKKVEIFSGTGGVGKTTLATTRAYSLAKAGKNILLITIDPSKRLKEVLKISNDSSGEIIQVHDPFDANSDIKFSAMLMDPTKTIKRIGIETGVENFHENRIVEILGRPAGGLNEILAIVELHLKLKSDIYDVIVLDTPPGSHFLDFLESSEKIEAFFDKKFIEIFKYITEKESVKSKGAMAMKFISSGINKLIGYLEKVTGASFVKDFVEAVAVIYKTKSVFLDSLELKKQLKDSKFANWYLVTSVDQNKLKEAVKLFNDASDFFTSDSNVLLNKCLEDELEAWIPKEEKEILFKESLLSKEKELKQVIKKKFNSVIEFKEVISNSPQEHILQLTKQWTQI